MTDVMRPGVYGSIEEFRERVDPNDFLPRPETPVYKLGNPDLPIAEHRDAIVASILENPVTIIEAPTGTGKSTQTVQYAVETRLFDEIIETQPRIIAAREIKERIEAEIKATGEDYSLGYYTSKEWTTEAPQHAQDIALLTDGKAAAQLFHENKRQKSGLKRLLIIDEAHEQNINIELLIALAMEKTNPRSKLYDPDLKIVIMSATMDSQRLQKHFAHLNPPIIKVTVPMYEVTQLSSRGTVAEDALHLAKESKGKVLAFLPGKREIRNVSAEIANRQQGAPADTIVPVIPLHGQQHKDEQKKALLTYEHGSVVATTNAAETSLTIPDVVAIVDSGLVRVDRITYDHLDTGSKGLYLEDAPQSSLDQRKGRGGRTAPATYVLSSLDGRTVPPPMRSREEYGTPAIQRTRLDGFVLRLKATGHEADSLNFFNKPPKQALKAAEQRLFMLGALDEDGAITRRGLRMESLPLDPEYAAMIVFAQERGYDQTILRHVIDIAAIMQLGGILKRAPQEQRWLSLLRTDMYGEKLEQDSDFFAQLEVYVALMNQPDKENWGKYDIIEHAADLVEQGRESLAKSLGITIHEPTMVTNRDDREKVLTCITAGQLTQLWYRKTEGDGWRLLLGSSREYDLSEATVTSTLGKLVTGSLFTLGTPRKIMTSIQDVTAVLPLETGSLEQAASHLVEDFMREDDAIYDPETKRIVAPVDRKLGWLVARSFYRQLDDSYQSPLIDKLRQEQRRHIWLDWPERKAGRGAYGPDEIKQAIAQPVSKQYGNDPLTGEPLMAWRGGNGQWCQTPEIAMTSLLARKRRLEQPRQQKKIRKALERERRQERRLNPASAEAAAANDPTPIPRPEPVNEQYTLDTIQAAIEHPVRGIWTNPDTNEEHTVWKGTRGEWHFTEDSAINSFKAVRRALWAESVQANSREFKRTIRATSKHLIELKKMTRVSDRQYGIAAEAVALLAEADKSAEWLMEARDVLERGTALLAQRQ